MPYSEVAGWASELLMGLIALALGLDYRRNRGTPERLAIIETQLSALRRDVERLLSRSSPFGAYHPEHDGTGHP